MVEQRPARFDSGRSLHCFSSVLRDSVAVRILGQVGHGDEVRVVVKVSTATIIGVLFGFAIGMVGFGQANNVSPELADYASKIHQYMLWIVLLSLLVPLADYFVSTNLPTTIIGYVARQPFRHIAGFFTGLAVGLVALILVAPQIL
jgi:hypothetical protein